MLTESPTDVNAAEGRIDPTRPRSSRKLLKRGLFILATGALVTIGIVYIANATSQEESGPKLTHTIKHGDLVVTVIEQGTLESSNNTEIKCDVRGSSTVIYVRESGEEVKGPILEWKHPLAFLTAFAPCYHFATQNLPVWPWAGDTLVRLDTRVIEEALSLTKTNTNIAVATLERTNVEVAKAEIAIDAYQNGRYREQMQLLLKQLEIAKRNLETSGKMLDHSKKLFKRGYVTELEVEGNTFTVQQAQLELKVKETEIDVLERYTKKMQLTTLKGNLKANRSKKEADLAGLEMERSLRDRAKKELAACEIRAKKNGLVIYPSAAAWKNAPDITKGATVRKDQVLLLMPDLTRMQIKVGIHESIIDRIKPGMAAKVTLSDRTLDGKVAKVAAVTKPAGWWTGNVVKYDTIIELPVLEGLKPGMSAEVEIVMARHENVLNIPVVAVLETVEGDFCWVKTAKGTNRRRLQLGDSNDVFIVVEGGLKAGDEVILNPLAFIDETQADSLKPIDKAKPRQSESKESDEVAASD